jgi:hypothetical protein
MKLYLISMLARVLGVTIYVDGVRRGALEPHGITD